MNWSVPDDNGLAKTKLGKTGVFTLSEEQGNDARGRVPRTHLPLQSRNDTTSVPSKWGNEAVGPETGRRVSSRRPGETGNFRPSERGARRNTQRASSLGRDVDHYTIPARSPERREGETSRNFPSRLTHE